ncbi:hypothetical protein [Tissierella praeacuta]|uniref:hypothetical protein n=2 Tax=Tissierella praeacuta TaxID=43131 RepID=UPI0028A2949D|nr:hypothetical protein [Tissierella praeacuta]
MMTEELGVRAERRGIFDRLGCNDDSLLFFFLILVIIFCNSGCFNDRNDDSLLFFFLLLVILFCGEDFF